MKLSVVIIVLWYFKMLIPRPTVWKFLGSAAAAFLTLDGMESLLSHQYFKTENRTEMYSDVITAVLPLMNNTNLTEPVNFTISHKKVLSNLRKILFKDNVWFAIFQQI